MNNFIITHLQIAISISIFYFVYHFFMRKEKAFRLNRVFLLSGLIVSVIIPFIEIGQPVQSGNHIYQVLLRTIDIQAFAEPTLLRAATMSITKIIGLVYLFVCLFYAIRMVYQIAVIYQLKRKASTLHSGNCQLYIHNNDLPPFSFFHTIFIGKNSMENKDIEKIIQHENAHIQQFHSIDILLVEAFISLFWYNPAIWLYRKAIKETHEYLADEAVLEQGCDSARYQLLLLSQSFGFQPGISNNFNNSLLKKRILMMKTKKSPVRAALKLALIAPLAFVLIFAIACKKEFKTEGGNQAIDLKEVNKDAPQGTYFMTEEMPQYPGGEQELRNFIAQNVKYPEEASKQGITGKVFVRFLINESGIIEQVSAAKAVNPLLDEEAIRVVKSMPAWTPGKMEGKEVPVWMTIPINFQLK
jgi:TonB family protein